jgi:23S rRNA (pseudouridine1915-N3)-methyltransferase
VKYCIICVGKIKNSYYRAAIEEIYALAKKKNHTFEIIEFPDEKIPDHVSEKEKQMILEKEGRGMKERITGKDFVIALCIEGKEITTKQHKEMIEKATVNGYERVVYLIGGSLGLEDGLKKRANFRLSFSKMTFPHQMMRMVLAEEIGNVM